MTICNDKDCNKQALYNIEGETKALYCGIHKKYGMIDVKSITAKIM